MRWKPIKLIILGSVLILCLAPVVLVTCWIGFRQFYGIFLIPSESMSPTFQPGTRVIVSRAELLNSSPKRGDIVMYYPPPPFSVLENDPLSVLIRETGFYNYPVESPKDKRYVHRIVGLPGETVQIVPYDGVYISGNKLHEPYILEVAQDCGSFCQPQTIPKGHYFLLGDGRNDSRDSRYFGFLPEDRLYGKVISHY